MDSTNHMPISRVKRPYKLIVLGGFSLTIGIVLFFVWILVGMLMSISPEMIDYYKTDSNYEEVACIIEEGRFKPKTEKYAKELLWLWEKNTAAVEESDFWKDIGEGDEVTVITAPGYFWDGYNLPVVGLRSGTKVYLSFSVGKQNQIEQLTEIRERYLSVSVPIAIGMSASFLTGGVFFFIFLHKSNNSKTSR